MTKLDTATKFHSEDVPQSAPFGSRLQSLLVATAVMAAILFLSVPGLQAQRAKPSEYEVEAAYLYNFGRFVGWPSHSGAQDDSFNICVFGQDGFGAILNNTLTDETIAGKSVVVKRIPGARDAANCRILFISASEESQLKKILDALAGSSVLTVSDIPEFSRRGGMVQFILDGSRVRFEINLASAERAGLTLSSELLKLAVNVRKNPAAGD